MFLLLGLLLPVVFSAAQDRMVSHWWRPDQVKVQYAGGTGFLSLGAGYQNKKQSLEGDLFYGYVPKSVGGVTIHMVTGKVTGQVLRTLNLRGYELRPLDLGISLTYTFGPQYFLFDPEYYSYAYYGFPTALHSGLFAGGRLSRRVHSHNIGVYYEVGTTDRELISWAQNTRALPVKEILHLAVGIRYAF